MLRLLQDADFGGMRVGPASRHFSPDPVTDDVRTIDDSAGHPGTHHLGANHCCADFDTIHF